ncbi:MAG: MATE family efflux transporter [Rikenellaceae bacterium]|nr:MATE family efflux transporter [Rikenellaceae bacterium]
MKNLTEQERLGTASIPRLIAGYATPAIIAMASSSIFNIVDSVFIGHGVGAMALSALAVAMPLMNILSAFGAMVGIGSASMISIRMGQGRKEEAFRILGNLVFMNVTIGVLLSLLGIAFLDEILVLFGASEATLPYAHDFMRVILTGNVVTHLYLGLNEVLRASGYPMRSMSVMLTAVGVNVCLNPLFIFVFKWGVTGSALATVLAQCTALAVEMFHYCNSKSYLHFKRGIFRPRGYIARDVLSIGTAPLLMNLCTCIVVIFINKALLTYGGDIYVGAYGIVNRIVMLFIMMVGGFNQGMQPIVGYNYGARRYDRVQRALWVTVGCAVALMTVACVLSQTIPDRIAGLFVGEDDPDGPQLVEIAARAMRTVMVIFPIVGFQIVASNFFQYIKRAKRAILLSTTRQLLFLVPLLIVLPPIYGTDGVWISMPIADGTASLLAAVLLFFEIRRLRRLDSRRSHD